MTRAKAMTADLEIEQPASPERQTGTEKTPLLPKEKLPPSLDRYEFTLGTGEKIVLALPPRLLHEDKERLKKQIDLIPDRSNDKADESNFL